MSEIVLYLLLWGFVLLSGYALSRVRRKSNWPTVESLLIERARLEHEIRQSTLRGANEQEIMRQAERICVLERNIRLCLSGQST